MSPRPLDSQYRTNPGSMRSMGDGGLSSTALVVVSHPWKFLVHENTHTVLFQAGCGGLEDDSPELREGDGQRDARHLRTASKAVEVLVQLVQVPLHLMRQTFGVGGSLPTHTLPSSSRIDYSTDKHHTDKKIPISLPELQCQRPQCRGAPCGRPC